MTMDKLLDSLGVDRAAIDAKSLERFNVHFGNECGSWDELNRDDLLWHLQTLLLHHEMVLERYNKKGVRVQ